jgi:hypothetical protein
MNPQHFTSARTALRWRGSLQEESCTDYMTVHHIASIRRGLVRFNHLLSIGKLPCWQQPCDIGVQIKNAETVYRTTNESGCSNLGGFPSSCSNGSLKSNPDNIQQRFNRMNGSPGAPPGTRMHTFKLKRITPFNNRLASDPSGKEAGWETTT